MNTDSQNCLKLLGLGWREYPDQFKEYCRCFYKRFETPTRCACNDNKSGLQVCISVSEWQEKESFEIDICGKLKTAHGLNWFNMHSQRQTT